jgi:uncharacterized surface protein with fasciclin (FAS1) repeats
MRSSLLLAVLGLSAFAAPLTFAQDTTAVAEPPVPAGDLVVVVTGSADHATLAGALTSAGLVATLQGEGPFTVFAPTDAAFEAVPGEHRAMLMDPAHAAMLSGVLTYHVVPERLDAATLAARITEGGGQATLLTVNGVPLTVALSEAGGVVLTDAAGNTATVTAADLNASNGVVHVIDVVMMPEAMGDDRMEGDGVNQ